MLSNRFSPSSSKPIPELPPKGPGLKRADSLPAQLPSNTPQSTEVKPIQGMMWTPGNGKNSPMNFSEEPFRPGKLSRAKPDTTPPVDFHKAEPGIMEEEAINKAANKKIQTLTEGAQKYAAFERKISRDPEAMQLIKSRHPDYDKYTDMDKIMCLGELTNHPRLRAEYAQVRNEVNAIPNGATGTRTMRWDEQVFLTNAFEELKDDFRKYPFHIHGETAIVGNEEARIVDMQYSPNASSFAEVYKDDKYHLHTHPPLGEPFASSASGADHMIAADLYLLHGNKMDSYVTNGKDVLHISPTSMELTRLIPDPKSEEKLVKFPVAFTLPEPQRPPNPFSNHEAPATFKPWYSKK